MRWIDGPLTFLGLTAAALLVSWRFKHDERWRPFHRFALTLSLVMLALFIVGFLNISRGLGFAGLAQRIMLVTMATWFLPTAARLRSLASGSV